MRTDELAVHGTVVVYNLTPKGREFLEKVGRTDFIDARVCAVVKEVVKEYGDMPLTDLLAVAKSIRELSSSFPN